MPGHGVESLWPEKLGRVHLGLITGRLMSHSHISQLRIGSDSMPATDVSLSHKPVHGRVCELTSAPTYPFGPICATHALASRLSHTSMAGTWWCMRDKDDTICSQVTFNIGESIEQSNQHDWCVLLQDAMCDTRWPVSAHLRLQAKDCLGSQCSIRRQGKCLLYIALHSMQHPLACMWAPPDGSVQSL